MRGVPIQSVFVTEKSIQPEDIIVIPEVNSPGLLATGKVIKELI